MKCPTSRQPKSTMLKDARRLILGILRCYTERARGVQLWQGTQNREKGTLGSQPWMGSQLHPTPSDPICCCPAPSPHSFLAQPFNIKGSCKGGVMWVRGAGCVCPCGFGGSCLVWK